MTSHNSKSQKIKCKKKPHIANLDRKDEMNTQSLTLMFKPSRYWVISMMNRCSQARKIRQIVDVTNPDDVPHFNIEKIPCKKKPNIANKWNKYAVTDDNIQTETLPSDIDDKSMQSSAQNSLNRWRNEPQIASHERNNPTC